MFPALHSFSLRDSFKTDPKFKIETAFRLCASMGFRSMSVITGAAGGAPTDIGADTVDGLKRVIASGLAQGVKINAYHPYNDFACVNSGGWLQDNIAYIQKWLRLAAETGVPNISMYTGFLVEGRDRGQMEDLVVKAFNECVPVAETCGVNMAVLNHHSLFFKGAEIVALIKRVGSPRLTSCPDPWKGFPLFEPTCTDADREAMYAGLEIMAPHATNSHLKVKSGSLAEWDLDRLIGIYKKANYTGALTMEWLGSGDPIPQLIEARQVLEAALQKHGVLRVDP